MQETRQHILDILREQGEATVNELVTLLCERRNTQITAVTVRHHLGVLREEGLVEAPQMRHRDAPGRPRHVYSLTSQADALFPNNYQRLAAGLMQQIRQQLPDQQVNVIFEGLADAMAADACIPGGPLAERLTAVVAYLNEQGYNAEYETTDGGYILRTCNCPYHHLARQEQSLCQMDMRLVASLLGVTPRMCSRVAEGDSACTYFIPEA